MKKLSHTLLPLLTFSAAICAIFSCSYQRPKYLIVREAYSEADSMLIIGQAVDALTFLFERFTDEEILTDDSLMLLQRRAYFSLVPYPRTRNIGTATGSLSVSAERILVTDYDRRGLVILNRDSLTETGFIYTGFPTLCVSSSTDGQSAAVGLENGAVNIYRLRDGELADVYNAHHGRTRDIVWSTANRIYSCGNDRAVTAYDFTEGKELWRFQRNRRNVKDIDVSPDGTKLISASNDGIAFVLDSAGQQIHRIVNGKNYCNTALIFPDRTRFATAGGEGMVKIYDIATGSIKGSAVAAYGMPVWKMAIDTANSHIAAAAKGVIAIIPASRPEMAYIIPISSDSDVMDLQFETPYSLIFITENGRIGRLTIPDNKDIVRTNHTFSKE